MMHGQRNIKLLVGMFGDFPNQYVYLAVYLQEFISLGRTILPSLFTFKPLKNIEIMNFTHKDK